MNLDSIQHVADPGDAPCAPCSFLRPTQIAGVTNLADIKPAQVEWLWPNRFPLGRLSLLVGDTALGKSLITLDIAARVSRGALWPDAAKVEGGRGKAEGNPAIDLPPSALPLPPSSVVLLAAEDNLTDTVLPRLEALGADCSRIYAFATQADGDFDGDDDQSTPHAGLRRDLKRLRSLLDSLPDCRLVVVDPITAYLAGSENSSVSVRRLLKPLAELARERRVAVIAVGHLRKKDGNALYRANGSLALVNSVRAVWLVARDPADVNRRLMLPIKSNLASDATGLAYTIDSAKTENSGTGRWPVIHWSTEPVAISTHGVDATISREPGRPDFEREQAKDWLRKVLADGPRISLLVQDEAKDFGFCHRTLARAFRDLGGQATRNGGAVGFWEWQLPVKECQKPGG